MTEVLSPLTAPLPALNNGNANAGDETALLKPSDNMAASPPLEKKKASRAPARPAIVCSQCGERDSLYTCPKCTKRTCSVDCCQRHKEATKVRVEEDYL